MPDEGFAQIVEKMMYFQLGITLQSHWLHWLLTDNHCSADSTVEIGYYDYDLMTKNFNFRSGDCHLMTKIGYYDFSPLVLR